MAQSLPLPASSKAQHPTQEDLCLLFNNPLTTTFRFPSGLGGDITVQEVMAESRYSFTFPQQLLRLWISEERQWQEELYALGNLTGEWQGRKMALLKQHGTLINSYNKALRSLNKAAHSGTSFKKSKDKGDRTLEMAPTNLHLQRLWANNEYLGISGFHDVHTCGIFSAYAQGYKQGGLANMLQKAKRMPGEVDRVGTCAGAAETVRQLRQELMRLLRAVLATLPQENTAALTTLLTKLHTRIGSLLNVMEPLMVEASLAFLDWIRLPQNPSHVLTLTTHSHSSSSISSSLSLGTTISLMYPDMPDLSGNGEVRPEEKEQVSAPNEIDILEGQENSVYWPTDEPEPWTMIQLNMQASIMSLNTKLNVFCDHINRRNKELEKASPDKCDGDARNNRSEVQHVTKAHMTETSSMSSDTSWSMMSSLGAARAKSQQASGSTFPEVTPFKEDNYTRLQCTVEMTQVDINSDGGMSVHDETEQRGGSSDVYESTVNEANKIVQSVVEQSTKDLGSRRAYIYDTQDQMGKGAETGDETDEVVSGLILGDSALGDGNSKVVAVGGKSDPESLRIVFKENRVIEESQNSNKVMSPMAETLSEKETVSKSEKLETGLVGTENVSESFGKFLQNSRGVSGASTGQCGTVEEVDWLGEVRPSMKKLKRAVNGLLRTAHLIHSIARLQQTPEEAELVHDIKYRRDVCFSQALTALVTGLMTRLWCRETDPVFVMVLAHLGPLAVFECLVSCIRQDERMLNDMMVVMEDLRVVQFVMVPSPGPQATSHIQELASHPIPSCELPMPKVSGNRCGLQVALPVPEHVFDLLSCSATQPGNTPCFYVTPVLFNIGINENATLAEKLGTDGPQTRNNLTNFKRLSQYYHCFRKLPLPQENIRRVTSLGSEVPLGDLIDRLGVEVTSKCSKNVNVLHLAAQSCREMAGLRFTSCKSGKDRTGMSVTLEQINILAAEYDLAETDFQDSLDCMRREGTRLQNCHKNIGSCKYNFSAFGLPLFPKQYHPPSGTYSFKYI